jgi:DNA-binding CsgD family transcriptional regulator
VSSKKNIRQWAQLRMLCCSGMDLMTIAPDAFAIAHELVPNAASALFLTSHDGVQQATYHEDCPEAVQSLCMGDGALFSGPTELTLQRLVANHKAPKLGQLWKPPREYFSSNTYQLLVRGCGHHHTIDARMEVNGRRIGMLSLFRETGLGFDENDLVDLGRIAQYFEHAAKTSAAVQWYADGDADLQSMVVANTQGEVVFSSLAASALLAEVPFTGSEWPDRRKLPNACLRLIDILKDNEQFAWQMPSCTVPLVGGMLDMHAQWMLPPQDATAMDPLEVANRGLIGIALTRRTPLPLRVWRNLSFAPLSPRQMEVAFWMALGGGREAARMRLSISEAVLRDCVKAVYERLGCSSEAELMTALRTGNGQFKR